MMKITITTRITFTITIVIVIVIIFLFLSSHSKIELNKVNRVEWHLTVVCFPPIALLGNSNCVSFEGNMESKVLI